MRKIENYPVTTYVFEDGPSDLAIEHVGHDHDSVQVICGGCHGYSDTTIKELAEVLAGLLTAAGQLSLAGDIRYRVIPGIKEP